MTSIIHTNRTAWQKLRRHYAQRLPCLCWRCGKTINPTDAWHLGHLVDRVHGGGDDRLAPEHARCSTSAGGTLGANIINAKNRALRNAAPTESSDRQW